jgi:glycolate oxidase
LVSGEHGIGLSKQKYLKEVTNPANIALMKSIKKSFDEKNILNAAISYNG